MSSPPKPEGLVSKFGYPTLLVAILNYLSQGLRSFASTASTLYFKSKFGFDPAELTFVGSLTFMAWYLKPIYGLLSDSLPIFGYRRRSYIFFSGLLGISSYLLMLLIESPSVAIVCLILGELSQAISDVICDGFLVERAKIDPVNGAHELQKVSWSALFFSAMVGMVAGGFAADYVDPVYLMSALAFCPLLVVIVSFVIPDKKIEESLSFIDSLKKMWQSLKTLWSRLIEKDTLRIIIFTMLWQSTAIGFGAIYSYYLLDILLIQPSTLSLLSFVGYLGSFIGTFFSGKGWRIGIIQKLLIGRILYNLISTFDIIIYTGFYESLGVGFYPFLYGPNTIGSAIDMYFSRMPILVIFTHITPPDIEATFFAGLSSLFNISMSLSDVLAGSIMYATGINDSSSQIIWVLTLISIGIGTVSLLFIWILPKSVEIREKNPGDLEEYKDIELPLVNKKGL